MFLAALVNRAKNLEKTHMRQIGAKNDKSLAQKWSQLRRPNHLRSQIGSPKVVRPVNFSRLASDFCSVPKPTPFCIAFWVDFGGQNPFKINKNFEFCDCYASRPRLELQI